MGGGGNRVSSWVSFILIKGLHDCSHRPR